MSDLLLFGPPLLMGAIGWSIGWFSRRSVSSYREQMRREGPAE